MRIVINTQRPAFSTIYKTCVFCTAGYILLVFCLAGFAALFGKLNIDPNFGYGNFVAMLISPVVVPVVFGFVLAVPGWAFWILYARFNKSRIVLHVDSLSSISEELIQPPQRNAGSCLSSGDSPTIETPSSLGPRG